MGYAETKNAFDSYVNAALPNKNYFESSLLRAQADQKLAFISFARPFKPRSTVRKAELVLHSVGDLPAASRSVTVKRQGQRHALYKRLTWANRPAAHSDGVTVTKTAALAGGHEWVFDVTAHAQKWSDGADFDGWEVSTTSSSELRFYSTDSTASWMARLEPELRVWVADEPDAPEDLAPSGNRVVGEPKPVLRWSQLDVNGDTSIVAAQVQIDNVVTFAVPDWDSGEQPVDDASMNLQTLTGPAFPGLPADGTSRFWRVRVQDGAGLWSDWSQPVSFRYLLKGTLTLVSPSASTRTVSDPTPPITWALAGATQRAYRLEIFRRHKTTTWAWFEAYDSGKITASTGTVTLPKGVLAWDDRVYKVRLSVWDTLNRQTTPGATAAYVVEREFWFDDDAATAPTDTISVTHVKPWPWVDVVWTNDVVPDRTIISRDGEVLADIEAEDLAALRRSDGSYRWRDRAPVPGRRSTYTVRPVSGGRMGWGNPSASITPHITGRWLVTDDFEVFVAGTEQDLAMVELATDHQTLGDRPAVRIIQGLKGWSGPVTGKLARTQTGTTLDNVSAATWRDRLLRIKRDQPRTRFVAGDIAVEVTVKDVVAPPTPLPRQGVHGDLVYDCSFGIEEAGSHDWEAYE